MPELENNQKLISRWLRTAEAGQCRASGLVLEKAPQLLAMLKSSSSPGVLLEMAFDALNNSMRKKQGTFYTPEDTALAMTERAVALFIKNNPDPEALRNIRILDPACGCGGFIIAALKVLLTEFRKMYPDIKEDALAAQIVQKNLFGIDCNANALTLLCERLQDFTGKPVSRKNFICADSLAFDNAADCFGSSQKFDIVIGNPPYVSYGLRNVGSLSAALAGDLRKRFACSAEYKINIYALFMEFAIRSTAENGVHSFIVPDSFLCGRYFSKIRKFMLEECAFEAFFLLRKKIFKAVPGALVIYFVSKKLPSEDQVFSSFLPGDGSLLCKAENSYTMLQSEFRSNHLNRFRLFFDSQVHKKVLDIEESSVCKLGDLLDLASGIIARNGKRSIISRNCDQPGNWQKAITSGAAVKPDGTVTWQGEYINFQPELIKSGIGRIDYSQDKLLIRQTGDRIVAAVDRNKLLVLNNIHVGNSKNPTLDLDRLAEYLNSPEMLFYYQATTLEADRPLAQTDLETLRELPMKEFFSK